MSTQTQTEDRVPPAVAKAQKVAADWHEKASTARAEAAELERGSGATILADPSAAEKLTIKIEAKERTARAYDGAAAEARSQEKDAWRKAVEAEADQLDKDAAKMRRDAEKHRADVEKILDRLEALDGVRYEARLGHAAYEERGTYYSADDAPRETKGQDLDARAAGAETQAELVRHVLKTGTASDYPGQPMLGYLTTPPITQAALAAGAL